jgi:hypothetical protein
MATQLTHSLVLQLNLLYYLVMAQSQVATVTVTVTSAPVGAFDFINGTTFFIFGGLTIVSAIFILVYAVCWAKKKLLRSGDDMTGSDRKSLPNTELASLPRTIIYQSSDSASLSPPVSRGGNLTSSPLSGRISGDHDDAASDFGPPPLPTVTRTRTAGAFGDSVGPRVGRLPDSIAKSITSIYGDGNQNRTNSLYRSNHQ